jgi:peptidoglycan/LPS O-acetylase OafA/YrhL
MAGLNPARRVIEISGNRDMESGIRLPQINGLRGIAIIGVVSYHIVAGVLARDSLPAGLSVLLTNGWSGVNLFFILSGFVLFLPCATDDRAIERLANPTAFYRRRCWRLLPLFYIGAIGSWALAIVGGMTANPASLLPVLDFSFILDAANFGPAFNVPMWSIGDEIAFSALFPLLALSFRRHGAVRVVAMALVVALAVRIAGIWRFPALQGPTFNSDMFACRIDEFVLGMALAQAYAAGWLPRRPVLFAVGGTILVILAWAGFDLVLREELPPLWRAVLSDVLDAGLAAIVVAALVPGTRLAAGLSWRPLQVAGMMCYSLYIWHLPLLRLIAGDRAMVSAAGFAGEIAAFLVVTVAVAALSYRFIEFPRIDDWRRLFLLRTMARV